MSTIQLNNLTFSYDGSHDAVFENVTLQFDTDWKLGLTGRNGKGKTTLLNLLLGKLPSYGSIQAKVNFEYFPYEISDKTKTVCEVIEQINPQYEEWKIQKELNLLNCDGLDFCRPFGTYSNGEQTKILLAVLFSKDGAFLLIDEPTNHLDRTGRQTLAQYLQKKASYIIVSHDKCFLDGCIDHVISINRSNIEIQSGNLSSYLANKRLRDDFETDENERLKADIRRLKDAGRQSSDWANKAEKGKYGGKQEKSGLRPDRGFIGAKATKVMKRASGLIDRAEKSAEEKSALLKNVDRESAVKIQNLCFFKNKLAIIKDLVIAYEGKKINERLSFEIDSGDRISLAGKNGCGKTSILKAFLGKIKPYAGSISYNQNLKISYVSQDTSFLNGSLNDFCLENKLDKTTLLGMLNKFGFEKTQFDKHLSAYSEGQKKKLLIAKSLCEQANLYLWDEPLNYIDIITREQIKKMLLNSNATMIFVEHDLDFCKTVASREITIQPAK